MFRLTISYNLNNNNMLFFFFFTFQIFTNKCSKGGCKQKEMMRVTCDQCHLNYCLKHRHPLDHDCKTDGKPLSKSGWVQSHYTLRYCSFIWNVTVRMILCFVSDMLLLRGPIVLPPPLPLVLVHLLQETLDLFLMVWVQITEATTVGKHFCSVLILNV